MLSEVQIMTENIDVFGHNSICIRSEKGSVYVDPFRIKEAANDAAYIFITHDHYDHFSPEDIDKVVGNGTILVVPEKMSDKAKTVSGKFAKVVTVAPGQSYEADGLEFETVAAYNTMKPFHMKSAGWVGYIIHDNGKKIYVAGDTDATAEVKAVKCDVALVPIGGVYTMDAKKAAEVINEMKPAVAIPVHYGSIVGSPKDAEEFAALVKEPVKVEIRIR